MKNNVGKEIKILSNILYWIAVIFDVILIIILYQNIGILFSLIIFSCVLLVIHFISRLIYGFGELIEITKKIEEKLNDLNISDKI